MRTEVFFFLQMEYVYEEGDKEEWAYSNLLPLSSFTVCNSSSFRIGISLLIEKFSAPAGFDHINEYLLTC